MFEYDQDIVDSLLNENEGFKRLYNKHGELKQRVKEAHLATDAIEGYSLEALKKEKLFLKDKMAVMINQYRETHA